MRTFPSTGRLLLPDSSGDDGSSSAVLASRASGADYGTVGAISARTSRSGDFRISILKILNRFPILLTTVP